VTIIQGLEATLEGLKRAGSPQGRTSSPLYTFTSSIPKLAAYIMAGSTTEKIQPWKSFPPPEKKAGGVYEYPELKKGDVMVTSTRSASFFEAHCGPKPTEDLAQASESRI